MTPEQELKLLDTLEQMNEAALNMAKSIEGLTEIAKILDRRISELEKARNAQ